jgi:hypothetical protein
VLSLRRIVMTAALVAVVFVIPGGPAGAQSCVAGTPSDFNGDGTTDIAIADPDATVNGAGSAGRVHVVYGGGGGSQTISQADSFVADDPESFDRFGLSLASVDWNGDGCTDLAVGAPSEAVSTAEDAGMVHVVYGSPSGLGPGGTTFTQDSSGMPGVAETGDRLGYSLVAGKTTSNQPFLVFGAPGEDVENADGANLVDAGAFHYVRGSTMLLVHQESAGVTGALEAGDLYGYGVAASPRHVVVGAPGEAIGSLGYSGFVTVFTHDVAAGTTDAWDQNRTGNSGPPEANDWCGRSLAVADYIPPGGTAANTRSLVAVGCPGEAVGTSGAAGRLVTLDATGTVTEVASVHQNSTDVDNTSEVGDYFGWSATVVNRAPSSPATWQSLLVAAGVPGEEFDTVVDAGGVQVFSAIGPSGDHDVWAEAGGLAAAGWQRAAGARLGQFVAGSRTHLYIADPFGATPAVYAIPWQNLTEGATAPVRVYKPGVDGLPTSGVGMFGGAIA